MQRLQDAVERSVKRVNMLQQQADRGGPGGCPSRRSPPQAESASSSLEEKQTALEELRRKIEARPMQESRGVIRTSNRAGRRQHCERALEARRLPLLQLPLAVVSSTRVV